MFRTMKLLVILVVGLVSAQTVQQDDEEADKMLTKVMGPNYTMHKTNCQIDSTECDKLCKDKFRQLSPGHFYNGLSNKQSLGQCNGNKCWCRSIYYKNDEYRGEHIFLLDTVAQKEVDNAREHARKFKIEV